MSTPADTIIAHWNRCFRKWSEKYTETYQSSIIKNCLFGTVEVEKGHRSALREIKKNKGNISDFVFENTEEKYHSLLPSKMLSDTYSLIADLNNIHKYTMVYRSRLDSLIQWKPGTSNALSKRPLDIYYGNEHFICKFRKYQSESMKKFIQATPGTKEIRGQWSVNVADDSMMVSFGYKHDVVVMLRIGCFYDKLKIMYEENGALRKNSKIRKQTLKTSCWGLEKTRSSSSFENSIIIQENYAIDICAHHILSISPIEVYVKTNSMHQHTLRINDIDIKLATPSHIDNIVIQRLTKDKEHHLRLKYRNTLVNNGKTNKNNKNKKENEDTPSTPSVCDEDDDLTDFYPIKPCPTDNDHDLLSTCDPFDTPSFNPFNPFDDYTFGYNYDHNNMNEMERLRQENEQLLQRVTEQQRQIDCLAAQIHSMQSMHYPLGYHDYGETQHYNPLKRRRITSESLLPPAA